MKYMIRERVTLSGSPRFHVVRDGKTVAAFGSETRAIEYAKSANRMSGREAKRQVREAWNTVTA